MTTKWPNERDSNNWQPFGDNSIDHKEGLRRLVAACPLRLPPAFDEATDWIAHHGDDTSELERRMSNISNELELGEFPENVTLLMTWACAETLSKSPTLQSWQNVRKLKSNSWQLDHWLSDAMLFYAKDKTSTKNVYIKLAKDVFEALDCFQLTSQYDRNDNERTQFRDTWNENREKLTEIWWGLRNRNPLNYEEDFPLFQLLKELDLTEFLAVVSQLKNPYLVDSAFWSVGVFSKYSLWEKFADVAPSAFIDDSTWNLSVTMPLLLVMAREQLLQAGRYILHYDPPVAEVEKVKQEIANVINVVVGTLAKRQDALPLFARWSTWLMRQLLMQGMKDANNVHSSAFVDATLIESIGRTLQGKIVISKSPSDAPAWEVWCYRAVLASHANNGFIEVPDYKNFLQEWSIKIDDWAGNLGTQLRERASLIVTMAKEIPGDAAHCLAYPIVMSELPVDAWIELWTVTQPLREIVEFGDSDALGSDGYQTRSEAGKLLLLVFSMGMAVLDQLVIKCHEGNSPQARDLAKLHEALSFAVREMYEIDNTLNMEQWRQAIRHLAVRRLIWEERVNKEGKDARFSVFTPTDKPTFSDYLSAVKNDAIELLAVLQMTLLNESDKQIIWSKLHSASIDLPEVIKTANQLNGISASKYPIDEKHLLSLISYESKYPNASALG